VTEGMSSPLWQTDAFKNFWQTYAFVKLLSNFGAKQKNLVLGPKVFDFPSLQLPWMSKEAPNKISRFRRLLVRWEKKQSN